jgi:indole-3-glycerol phosphate synthase
MDILEKIVADKKIEVEQKRVMLPYHVLEKYPHYEQETVSLHQVLARGNTSGIITEFKRRSPSKGVINDAVEIVDVVKDYEKFGAAGVSVLTDEKYFGGFSDDLMVARETVSCPILRKDFIIDEYQIVEAKAIGADLILLIAACLTPAAVKRLAAFAVSLGLEVLLELHDEEEVGHICKDTALVGINNRNLKTFEVNIERSLKMGELIPDEKIRIAESGISSPANIKIFKQSGFSGFLIGENFMKQANPGEAFRQFVEKLGGYS